MSSSFLTKPNPAWTNIQNHSLQSTNSYKRRSSTNSIPSLPNHHRSSSSPMIGISTLPLINKSTSDLPSLLFSLPEQSVPTVSPETIPAPPATPPKKENTPLPHRKPQIAPYMSAPGLISLPEPAHAPLRSPKLGRVSFSKRQFVTRIISTISTKLLTPNSPGATTPAPVSPTKSFLKSKEKASPSDLSIAAVRVSMTRGVYYSPPLPSSPNRTSSEISPKSPRMHSNSSGLTTLSQLLGLTKPTRIVVMFTLDELKVLPPVEDLSPYFGLHSPALVGLLNIGNTCYMAAALQCLGSIDVLTNYLINETVKTNPYSNTKGAMVKAYVSLLRELTTGRVSVNLRAFKRDLERIAPQFDGYDQQDAQEFLRFLLDALSSDMCRVLYDAKFIVREEDEDALPANEKSDVTWAKYLHTQGSVIADVFSGQLRSSIRCWACNSVFYSFDVFWDLSVAIPPSQVQRTTQSGNDMSVGMNQVSLFDCLTDFAKEEELERNEWYHCPKCQKQQRTSRQLQVNRMPMVIVIHIKRFASLSSKLTTPVLIPMENVDMSASTIDPSSQRYRLVAVLEHSGSLSFGHYVASVNRGTGWYRMDDGQVSRISDPEWTAEHEWSRSAYVLFYQQTNPGVSSLTVGAGPMGVG